MSAPSFEQALDKAAADARPAPPAEGIPAQRWPMVVRRPIQLAVLPYIWIEGAMTRLVRVIFPPAYRLAGACQMTGACCRYVLVHFPPVVARSRLLSGLLWWWTTEINGFYARDFALESETDGSQTRVVSCRHLQADGRCGSYRLRPQVCRRWPRQDFFHAPFVLKGCGYRVEPRDGGPALPARSSKLPVLPSDDPP